MKSHDPKRSDHCSLCKAFFESQRRFAEAFIQGQFDFGRPPELGPDLVGLHDAPLSTLWHRPRQVAQGDGPGGVAGG
jgi:hypothetical protein